VLIKFGLDDIPALTFAGLRYLLAFLILIPFTLRPSHLTTLRALSKDMWFQLLLLGFLFYSVTQGAQFLGLFYLPAITVNLLLSFTVILVALLGILILGERPTPAQWAGTTLYLGGVFLFFYPAEFPSAQTIGIIVVVIGVIANALSSILGRHVNRSMVLSPSVVTVISMGIGAIFLLITGIIIQGFPILDVKSWAIVLWLAVVNSAFAFTLWNNTLRTLSAMESSIINNTMMIQIPLLAWLFLDEQPSVRETLGMILAGVGILIVQLRFRRIPSTDMAGGAKSLSEK
jgi:drug/metabolite transporter (DMT)-like permease